MKVVWNLEKTVAIPVSNICAWEIGTTDDWTEKARKEWTGGRFFVIARYVICIGAYEKVFEADSKEECIKFIESI